MRTLAAMSPLAKFTEEPWRTRILSEPSLLQSTLEEFEINIKTSRGSFKVPFMRPFTLADFPIFANRPDDAQATEDWLLGLRGDETSRYGIVELIKPKHQESVDALIFKRDRFQSDIDNYKNTDPEKLTDDQISHISKTKALLKEVAAEIEERISKPTSINSQLNDAIKESNRKVLVFLQHINQKTAEENQMVEAGNFGKYLPGVTEQVAEYILRLEQNKGGVKHNVMADFIEDHKKAFNG